MARPTASAFLPLLLTPLLPAQLSVPQGESTPSGPNGLATLTSTTCAALNTACDILIPPAYPTTDFSRYFDPQKAGNNDFYALFPTLGGIARPRFAEDRRGANRYQVSINPTPVAPDVLYNDRTPFVWEVRTSNTTSYSENLGAVLIRQRVSGGGHNYLLPFAPQKDNTSTLALDTIVRSSNQGGGTLSSTLAHTAPGDDMVITIQHDTNGCSEGEDECDKLFRAFLETTTERWGGTLKAAPTLDPAGFGNYALDATVTPGYNPAQAGEDVFLVDLARPYTAGNVTAILDSQYPNFAKITGDAAAAWSSRFGASVITPLTAPIDNLTYNTACPATILNNTPRYPDPMITTESGTGGFTAFCATVASTAGLHDGDSITIAGFHSNIEITRIVHVVDPTHLTLNAQMYHDKGEYISAGGAQGYGISMLADDIRPGALLNYYTHPKVTLHKFFPILGSDAQGNLYVYTNAAQGHEISSVGYMANHPNQPARGLSVAMERSAVVAVALTNADAADYRATPQGLLGSGQITLAPPTVTFSGSCARLPTAIASYPHSSPTGLTITVTNPGSCTGVPKASLQSEWPNPYRIAPLVITKKVIDPATGSTTNGHLLVGNLKPSDWHQDDAIEIPGWIHDHAASMRVFGKYFTGSSRQFGISDMTIYNGDWAYADTLMGILNQTDGHKYYPSAAQPFGPGVAYEDPPNGFALAGDFRTHLSFYTPPSQSVIDVGCLTAGFGTTPYHPCFDGIVTPYNLFQLHGASYSHTLRFDPTLTGRGLLAWSGPFAAQTIQLTPQPGPTCNSSSRGTFNYIAGSKGQKDTVQVCAKDAADTFAWRTLY